MGESLEVEGLRVRFPDFTLQDVSFRVPPGSIVGFLGENGAGKTTTLRLVMGLLRKEAGGARIAGHDHVLEEKAFKRRVAFVDEETHFYARMSVGRLLDFVSGFYADWDARRCDELLARFQLSRTQRAGALSKGMKTKLRLILALAHRPDVLLLDEPTSGLDPRARVELFELLEAVRAEGRGVLFSSHQVQEVERLADRVLVIDKGRILVDESLAALRARARDGEAWSLERFFLETTQREAPAQTA